jgi:Mn2+/Fe2+ NRAMP family transporter
MNLPLAIRLPVESGAAGRRRPKRGNLFKFGLPFALVPLLVVTARRSVTGTFVNRTVTTAIGSAATGIVVALNGFTLVRTFGAG